MKRNEFIKKSSTALFLLSNFSDLFSMPLPAPSSTGKLPDLATVSPVIRKKFEELVEWMIESGWDSYFKNITGKSTFDWSDDLANTQDLNNIGSGEGLDDFAGNKLIEPGNPSLSLVYHALASPRVNNNAFIQEYPRLEHLDVLENYIYALKKWEDYDREILNKENAYLMVLSYEYRPAFKTPGLGINWYEDFPKHAQLVFSRCGISRIGDKKYNYDKENRCFTNRPADPENIKHIASTPSRYGLFLVELVRLNKNNKGPDKDTIKIMNYLTKEYTKVGPRYHRKKKPRHFIRPIRKIFEDVDCSIRYGQYHVSEKLKKMADFCLANKSVTINPVPNLDNDPFSRIDASDEYDAPLNENNVKNRLVSLERYGSSVLLVPWPAELVRIARQSDKNLSFTFPKEWKKRYAALKLVNKDNGNRDIRDALSHQLFDIGKNKSNFWTLRNAPLFLNIKHFEQNGKIQHLNEHTNNFEKVIEDSDYAALLFEDSMCDGCVSVEITLQPNVNTLLLEAYDKNNRPIKPAFSLVAAPDFFPFCDSNDIRKYYLANSDALDNDEDFYQGGTLPLSVTRQRGNPRIKDPFTKVQAFECITDENPSFDTLTAVVSNVFAAAKATSNDDFKINFKRDYHVSSYMPDTGTGIFYPGWDATYSGGDGRKGRSNPYLASFGLGSPFPEDMKLCAAANGMWAALTPDAGRTFQGALESLPVVGKPNTSIPLMDDEIGIHPQSTNHKNQQPEGYGWDGEHGPFLQFDPKNESGLVVNYTDIGRADYVANLLNKDIGFNMSKLRTLTCRELIHRMHCLRTCIKAIDDNTKVKKTAYWLISAEKVDWQAGAHAFGIPQTLVGADNVWAKQNNGLTGNGFLFLFALTEPAEITEELENPTSKRRNQKVKKICVCKVTNATLTEDAKIRWCEFLGSFPKYTADIQWHQQ